MVWTMLLTVGQTERGRVGAGSYVKVEKQGWKTGAQRGSQEDGGSCVTPRFWLGVSWCHEHRWGDGTRTLQVKE